MRASSAPIRHIPGRVKSWMLDLRYLGGSREFFATEDEAKAARREAIDTAKSHGAAALSMSHTYRAEFSAAQERLTKIGLSISQAVDFCERFHSSVQPIQMPEAVERFLDAKAAIGNKDPEYLRILASNLNSFCLTVREKSVSEVTQEDVDHWLDRNGWAPATIRNKQIDIGTFFSFASKRKWILEDPTAHREPIALGDSPIGILKPDETEALLSAAQGSCPRFLPYVVLGLFCGLRADEASQLEQKRIQIERGFVEVPAYRDETRREGVAKTRQRRLVDLSANAKAWLKICEPIEPRAEHWHSRQLKIVRPAAALLLAKVRAVEITAFPWPKNCMRHSFASYHLAQHGDAGKTAMQLGHGRGTDTLFRHYRELVTREEAERYWSILPAGCIPFLSSQAISASSIL